MLTAIAKHLASKGIVTWTETGIGADVFIETMPDTPNNAVALMSTGGDEPNVRHPFDTRNFQVLIRGGADPRPPYAKTLEIYSELQGLAGTTLDGGLYVVAIGAVQAGPIRVGPDQNNRHRYSLNFWARVHAPTEHR